MQRPQPLNYFRTGSGQGSRPSGARNYIRPIDKDEPLANNQIRASRVRLIGPEGENYGVLSLNDAKQKARDHNLDLVAISPNADPMVCKLLELGKFKYEIQKKKNEARKKQKVIAIKEIKIRPNIDDHDYDIKIKSILRFLAEGDKVKITLRFRGREMANQGLGFELLNRLKSDLTDKAKVEQSPTSEGRQIVMLLVPAI